MQTSITRFENSLLGDIRVVTLDRQPWFVAKDICVCLEIGNSRQAVSYLDEDEKAVITNDTPGGKQEMSVVSESGMYSLILRSRKPEAKLFRRWITHEVIPAIRRDGGYMMSSDSETDEQLLARALRVANAALVRKNAENAALVVQIEKSAPKVLFANAVDASRTTILIGDLAKFLRQNGFETGQKRLFQLLRNDGFLMSVGSSKNMPTQKSMELGLFEVKERAITNPDGSIRLTRTTKVTGKGQIFFVNRYCAK